MELSLQWLRRTLAELLVRSQALIVGACHPYRPELHYMRGPGPKWHARHPAALRD
ncbi:hypothetical protein JQ633_11680 [Bradyrhizobium tropiciagri]|uniref:hypothetical protein n=1 Tax=Bradyrhizobium tropiciagri TaxID=312253 RepID=UPI001BA49CB5|nr:hypothetical protein [Bradyrhizobium tropiciagri]MBR0871022.1 hypothetical protein [Bradyrhizobium tropiciagri]